MKKKKNNNSLLLQRLKPCLLTPFIIYHKRCRFFLLNVLTWDLFLQMVDVEGVPYDQHFLPGRNGDSMSHRRRRRRRREQRRNMRPPIFGHCALNRLGEEGKRGWKYKMIETIQRIDMANQQQTVITTTVRHRVRIP